MTDRWPTSDPTSGASGRACRCRSLAWCAMGESYVPSWLRTAQEVEELLRYYQPVLEAAQWHADDLQRLMPEIQVAQQGAEEVWRLAPLIHAAQQHLEDARREMTAAGPSLASGQELALAMDAGMKELLWSLCRRIVYAPALPVAGAIGFAHPALVVYVTDTDTVTMTEDQTMAVQESRSPAVHIDAMTVFLAILWLFLILLALGPLLGLSAEVQLIIGGLIANVSFGLTITFRVIDKRKHDSRLRVARRARPLLRRVWARCCTP